MSPPAIPRAETPEVSVVMVTHNAWEWTERALTALVEHTDPCFELIVVDNASRDGTLEGLAALTGATVLRNAENTGFGPAVNQAALHARAPVLGLLNTDALVHPGWLPPLRAVLDESPGVAVVAPRLLHLDGTVQEAGSIVWGDAEVWPYGADQAADRPEYRFRRRVDYASGACLLLRRSAFVDAGGFDPVFAPAYFEDVDLSLRLWDRGLATVCQPASEVTHAAGRSTDRARRNELLARNRDRFADRWRRLLAGRPRSPVHWEPQDVLPGRDLRCGARVLIAGDFVPAPSEPRLTALLCGLVEVLPEARITYLALDDLDAERNAPPLLAAGVEVAWPGEGLGTWLAQRRHHYGLVLAASWAAAMPPVRGLIDAAQPHAHRGMLLDGGVEAALADAAYRDALAAARLLLCAGEDERDLAARSAPAAAAVVLPADRADPRWAPALTVGLTPLGIAPTPGRGCSRG